MSITLEEYLPNSVLQGVPPGFKMAAFALFAFAAGQVVDPLHLLVPLTFSCCVVACCSRNAWVVLRRALQLQLPLLLLPVTMPFSVPGPGFIVLGAAFSWEGLRLSLMIMARVFLLSSVLMAFLTSEHPYTWFASMRKWGAPVGLVALCCMGYRYVWVIADEYAKLWAALKVRGFSPRFDRRTYRTFGYLLGMLMVRTHARGVRVSKAICLRGFQGLWFVKHEPRGTSSILWGLLLVAYAGGCLLA